MDGCKSRAFHACVSPTKRYFSRVTDGRDTLLLTGTGTYSSLPIQAPHAQLAQSRLALTIMAREHARGFAAPQVQLFRPHCCPRQLWRPAAPQYLQG